MKNPPHLELSVKHEPLGLSIAEGARVLGVTRQAMNNLVSGKAGVSAEMAIRLEKTFGGAEMWLRLQQRMTWLKRKNKRRGSGPARQRCLDTCLNLATSSQPPCKTGF